MGARENGGRFDLLLTCLQRRQLSLNDQEPKNSVQVLIWHATKLPQLHSPSAHSPISFAKPCTFQILLDDL